MPAPKVQRQLRCPVDYADTHLTTRLLAVLDAANSRTFFDKNNYDKSAPEKRGEEISNVSKSQSHSQLLQLAANPAVWPSLNNDTIANMVIEIITECGACPNAKNFSTSDAVYAEFVRRFTNIADRLGLCLEFVRCLSAKPKGVRLITAIHVPMKSDPAHEVVCAATCSLIQLMPVNNGDPLTGSKSVINLVLGSTASFKNPGAALATLLALEDQQVTKLVDHAWWQISDQDRIGMARTCKMFAHDGVLEFLLSRLEQGPIDAVFNEVADVICNTPLTSRWPYIAFTPVTFPDPVNWMGKATVRQQWGFAQYLQKMQARLTMIAQRGPVPQALVQKIVATWGRRGLQVAQPRKAA